MTLTIAFVCAHESGESEDCTLTIGESFPIYVLFSRGLVKLSHGGRDRGEREKERVIQVKSG